MESYYKDLIQIGVSIVAIIGGLVAVSQALTEMRRSNDQRREDMRWKQAEMAKKCLDEMFSNGLARAAMKMLDWSGLTYTMPGRSQTAPIEHATRREALRTSATVFTTDDPAPFIRDAYDELFDNFERLEHFVVINLILFEDIKQPLAYYVAKLAKPEERAVIELFLQAYKFHSAQKFLNRFPEWSENGFSSK